MPGTLSPIKLPSGRLGVFRRQAAPAPPPPLITFSLLPDDDAYGPGAELFDGAGDSYEAPGGGAFAGMTGYAASIWFNNEDTDTFDALVSEQHPTDINTSHMMGIDITPTNLARMSVRTPGGTQVRAETPITPGQVTHGVFWRDGGVVGVQVNESAPATVSGTIGSFGTQRTILGAKQFSSGSPLLRSFFKGLLKSVVFYDRPPTEAERAALYAAGPPRSLSDIPESLQSAVIRHWLPAKDAAGFARFEDISAAENHAAYIPGQKKHAEVYRNERLREWGEFTATDIDDQATWPIFREGPRRVEFSATSSMRRDGATALGQSHFTLSRRCDIRSDNLGDGVIHPEINADGSGLRWIAKAGGILSLQYLSAGGTLSAEVNATDSIHGRRQITGVTATEVVIPGHDFSSAPPLDVNATVFRLAVGTGHPFRTGDTFLIPGWGVESYPGYHLNPNEHIVRDARPEEGWIEFSSYGHGLTPPSAGQWVEANGGTETLRQINAGLGLTRSEMRSVVLRIERSGEHVEFFCNGRTLGGESVSGLPIGTPSGTTTYLGTYPGSPMGAAPMGVERVEGYDGDLTEVEVRNLDARLSIGINRHVDWTDSTTFLDLTDFALIDRGRVADHPILRWAVDDATGEIVGRWANPGTGHGSEFASGVWTARRRGDKDLSEPWSCTEHVAVWDRPYDDDGTPRPHSLIWSGPVAKIERRPLDARWQVLHVSNTTPGASDSNPGTVEAPLLTFHAALRRSARGRRFTEVVVKDGDEFANTGPSPGTRYLDFHDAGSDFVKESVRVRSAGSGRFAINQANNGVRLSSCFDVRVSDLDASLLSNGDPNPAQDATFSVRNQGTNIECAINDSAFVATSQRNTGFFFDGPNNYPGPTLYYSHDNVRINCLEGNTDVYGIYNNSAMRRASFTRIVNDHHVNSTGSHSLRSMGGKWVEFAHMTRTVGRDSASGFRNYSVRHEMSFWNLNNFPDHGRVIHESNPVALNASYRCNRYENLTVNGINGAPAAHSMLANVYATGYSPSGSIGLQSRATLAGANEMQVRAGVKALNVRSQVNTFSGFDVIPTSGPHARAFNSGGDFGVLSAPAIAHAESSGGVVYLRAAGYPLGGVGRVKIGYRRRLSSDPDGWGEVEGAGLDYHADRTVTLGQSYVYRTVATDSADPPNVAYGPESSPITVA